MSEPLMNTSDNRNGQDEAIYQGTARGSTVSGANTIPGGSPVSRRSTGIPARNAFFCFMAAFIWGTAFVAQRVGGEHMGPSGGCWHFSCCCRSYCFAKRQGKSGNRRETAIWSLTVLKEP